MTGNSTIRPRRLATERERRRVLRTNIGTRRPRSRGIVVAGRPRNPAVVLLSGRVGLFLLGGRRGWLLPRRQSGKHVLGGKKQAKQQQHGQAKRPPPPPRSPTTARHSHRQSRRPLPVPTEPGPKSQARNPFGGALSHPVIHLVK